MSYRYAVYGLRLSADRPIPGLFPDENTHANDLTVHLGGLPARADIEAEWCHVSELLDGHGEAMLRVARTSNPSGLYFRYGDGTTFIIDDGASALWAAWRAPLTLEDTATYLLGPMLGFVLRLRGVLSLHASVVSVEGQALAFMGAAGAGKSTLAAAFAQRGFAVVSDDVLALDMRGDEFIAQPGYPRLRLWPDSVAALFGASESLPRLTPNWDKRYLALGTTKFRFQSTPLPLGALYVIGNAGTSMPAPIAPMKAREAMVALLRENAEGALTDKATRAREFRDIGRLVERVPIRRLSSKHSEHHPEGLVDKILKDRRTHLAPAHV